MSIETRLAEIEQREKAATPKPWTDSYEGEGSQYVKAGEYTVADLCFGWATERAYKGPSDAEFIAAARQDVPFLTKALREALAGLREIKQGRAFMAGMKTVPMDEDQMQKVAVATLARIDELAKEGVVDEDSR